MTYVIPSEFIKTMIDSGAEKVLMNSKKAFIRSYLAGSILSIAAAFAITITLQTGYPIIGAAFFPVGFSILYLMGFDLLTGVFMLSPLALIDGKDGVTLKGVLQNWGIVFFGNFSGALMVAFLMSVVFTFGYSTEPDLVGQKIASIGEIRTLGYKEHGSGGMVTIFIRGVLCNWMVSLGVVGAMISKSVSGKVISMWMPIMIFFGMGFEHSIVNMYLFPSALIMGGHFTIIDYLVWNEIPVILGNLVGGLLLTGLPLYMVHINDFPRKINNS